MKKLALLASAVLLAVSGAATAKDEHLQMPIEEAMNSNDVKNNIDGTIKFYFGKQKHPKPKKTLGTFTANKKTNFTGKSNNEGCTRAFASAMISLQERAKKEGGNAVIGIKSVYRNENLESETEYICGAGTFMGGVALRGEVAELP